MKFGETILALFIFVILSPITISCHGSGGSASGGSASGSGQIMDPKTGGSCILILIICIMDILSPTATDINCDNDISIYWAAVIIGGVMTATLLIAVIMCMIFTGIADKGLGVLIQYLSGSARANGEHDIQPQQEQPQHEGIADISLFSLHFSVTILHCYTIKFQELNKQLGIILQSHSMTVLKMNKV